MDKGVNRGWCFREKISLGLLGRKQANVNAPTALIGIRSGAFCTIFITALFPAKLDL